MITAKGLVSFYLAPNWRCTIECGELILRRFDKFTALAVGEFDSIDGYQAPEKFTPATTAMYVFAESLDYVVSDDQR